MSDKEKTPEEIFNEIVQTTNFLIREETTKIMDIHHETIQHSRRVVHELREFQARYEDAIDLMIMAHADAAKRTADLYGDAIVGELGGVVEEELEYEEPEEETE